MAKVHVKLRSDALALRDHFQKPSSAAVDLTLLQGMKFQNRRHRKIFYAGIDLPIDDIAEKSDFFEKQGKDQHAYCTTIDRGADVRMLLNIKPNARWIDTMLHESGHAVYFKWTDRNLPYNLRDAAHIFTTEGVAMMFGALAKNPRWLGEFLKVDPKVLNAKSKDILAQRQLSNGVHALGAVMLHFEKRAV
jgi:peptidyl-dipeptidase A